MSELYPLKFKTIFKDKIWGGQKIRTVLGKDFGNLPNCGETWEISGVPGNVSIVSEGSLMGESLAELLSKYKGQLVGNNVYEKFGDRFPLLVKFIDANDDLSIQVHPDDELAQKRHDSFGKTEMWYVFQADKEAKLVSGFNQPMSREKYLEFFEAGKLTDILNYEEVHQDDVFFLPAGRVHTIGKGLLLAEIQQTSDVTYRIYDFNRVDDQGNHRELHVDDALDAIAYNYYQEYKTKYQDKKNEPVPLVSCEYFTTNKLMFDQSVQRNLEKIDSFKIYVCMEGAMEIIHDKGSTSLKKGEAALVPAVLKHYELKPVGSFKALESYID